MAQVSGRRSRAHGSQDREHADIHTFSLDSVPCGDLASGVGEFGDDVAVAWFGDAPASESAATQVREQGEQVGSAE